MKSAEWSHVIEELQQALDRVSAELSRHEQALASPLFSSDLADEHQIGWQRALERFGEGLEQFQKQVDLADQRTAETEEKLAQHEAVVRSIHQRFQEVSRALADAAQRL